MKKILLAAAFVALLVPLSASAQNASPPNLIAADAQLAIPVGNLSDGAGIGFGVLGRYERNLIPKLNITGRIGFIYHLSKDSSSGVGGTASLNFYTIPILVGVKYDLTNSIFGAAELGIFSNHATASFGGMSVSSGSTDFGITLGGGFRLTDQMEVRLNLHIMDLGNAGDSLALVGGFGYTFWRG
jgi:hypothetical protein